MEINQSISLLYALSARALLAAGLDPTTGLHHKTRYSIPLVYDYSEMFKPVAVHAAIKAMSKAGRLPGLDKDGYLTKESMRFLFEEFFYIFKARIRGAKITPHRAVYVNAFRLAARIRGDKSAKYTFTYNPKKLKYPER
ncbi:CRISPR-associated endonuclease Cas1 [Thermogladius sp.]|uniref:CRISPR-associated endonuclease Cas1 n=1 Tax=Thermogladius sp. TaxID=2023064 RepID=UPI003D137A04